MTHLYTDRRTITPRALTVATVLLAVLLGGLPATAADTPTDGPGVVNINEASAEQLAQLPRVGPALSGRIVEFREANGRFESPEDLILVRGIGEKTFELLEPFVVVKGETTLSRKLRTRDLPKTTAEDGAEERR